MFWDGSTILILIGKKLNTNSIRFYELQNIPLIIFKTPFDLIFCLSKLRHIFVFIDLPPPKCLSLITINKNTHIIAAVLLQQSYVNVVFFFLLNNLVYLIRYNDDFVVISS